MRLGAGSAIGRTGAASDAGLARSGGLRVLMTLDAVGGVWRYALDLATGLRAAGDSVAFLGFGPAPSPQQWREAAQVGPVAWSDAPLDWLAQDVAALARVPAIIAAAARDTGAGLVHLNLPSQAAALKLDMPVVVVSHSCVVTWNAAMHGTGLAPGWRWQEQQNRAGLRRADAVIAPSRAHAALLQGCYGPLRDLHVVANACAAPDARLASAGPAPDDHDMRTPFVLAMGRWWDAGKDAATLDAAAPAFGWRVVALGSAVSPGGDRCVLRHLDHRGEVPHAVAAQYVRRAGIFVSPSVYEPFGLAALEAARAGVPLVLSDIPTYRELWGGAAVFFAPRDAAALAAAVNALVRDPDRRRRMGAAAVARAARYTVGAQVAAMRGIYRALAPQPAATAAAR